MDIHHFPTCRSDYPEKPEGEAPQEIVVTEWGDGDETHTCVDCGACVTIDDNGFVTRQDASSFHAEELQPMS